MKKEDIRILAWDDTSDFNENSVQVNGWVSQTPEHKGNHVFSIQTMMVDSTDDLDEHPSDEVFLSAQEIDLDEAIEQAKNIAREHDIRLIVIKDKLQ